MATTADYRPLAPREALVKHVEERPDATAVIDADRGETTTYAEFDARTDRLASALSTLGLSPGDRLGMVQFNTPAFLEVMMACYKLGVVHVPMNPRFAPGEIQYVLEDTDASVVVYDAEIQDTVHRAVEQSTGDQEEIVVHGASEHESVHGYETLVGEAHGDVERASLAPDDPRYILYTSGTTGEPKGVVVDDETIRSRALEYPVNFGLDHDTVAVNLTPWFHGAGVEAVIHPLWLTGGTIVSVKHPDIDSVLSLIGEHDVTYVVNSITHTQRIVQRHEEDTLPEADFTSVNIWFPMGQAIPRQLAVDAMDVITENLFTVYGSTEVLLGTITRPRDLPEKAGKDGISSIQNRVRVVEYDEDRRVEPHETVDRGETGEIICRSPVLPSEYYDKPEETAEAFYKGWFYTDDMGVVHEDGFLSVKGRVSDMIVSGGENIAAAEVEEALLELDEVLEAAVVGAPDEEFGERITAFVVTESGVSEDDLDRAMVASDSLADFKRPRQYEFVEDLPTTETGKVQRNVLRDRVSD